MHESNLVCDCKIADPDLNDHDDDNQYAAYVDPSNPDDIVLAMPDKDNLDEKENNRRGGKNKSSQKKEKKQENNFFDNGNTGGVIGETDDVFSQGINLDELPDMNSNDNGNIGNTRPTSASVVTATATATVEDDEDGTDESGNNGDLPPKIPSSVKAKPQPMSNNKNKNNKRKSKIKNKNKNKNGQQKNVATMALPQIGKVKSVSDMEDSERDLPDYSPLHANTVSNSMTIRIII